MDCLLVYCIMLINKQVVFIRFCEKLTRLVLKGSFNIYLELMALIWDDNGNENMVCKSQMVGFRF